MTLVSLMWWLLLGVMSYAINLAYEDRKWESLADWSNVAFAVLIGLTGPIGLFVTLIS